MATEVVITEQDRTDAENILEQYMTDAIPLGDFSKGSALRDLAITALASVYAYMRKEAEYVRVRQSLLLADALTDDDRSAAVEEILSNWFIVKKSGRQSRGTVTVFMSEQEDVSVPTSALFYKTSALSFALDSTSTVVVAGEDMTPVTDSTGAVVAYSFTLPVIASQSGAEYDVVPGPFVDYTRFSPYIIRVENENTFAGGASDETTDELLERAPTAISVRDLNSARSIDAVLKEEFTTVDDVTVVGYGDAEMQRDLILEGATQTRIHAGGHVDAYLRTPITEGKTTTGIVGGEFTDPRPGYYVLRDDTLSASEMASIVEGDVIIIYNNLGGSEPDRYIVQSSNAYGIAVSRRTPFPSLIPVVEESFEDGQVGTTYTPGDTDKIKLPTTTYEFTADDVGKWIRILGSGVTNANMASGSNNGTWEILAVDTINNTAQVNLTGIEAFVDETAVQAELQSRVVEYSIGDNGPSFDNHVSRRISGRFTKSVQSDGRILLPDEPIYRITDVSFESATNPYTVGGRVTFPNRSNLEPEFTTNPDDLQYRVLCSNPEEAPSGWQLMEVDIGWPDGVNPNESKDFFNDESLRVTYDALTGYDTVWAFMLSDDQRILCGSVIPKGLNPVYITVEIQYRLAKTATDTLDTADATEALVAFINDFDTREDLDSSDIVAFLRENYDVIGNIEPITFYYQLLAPDGRVISYKSTDVVSIDDGKTIDPDTDAYPLSSQPELIMDDPLAIGVSDNTVRYLTVADLITFTELD